MHAIIVATRNADKTREIEQILGPDFAVQDLTAYPAIPEITESGTSFEENAKVKAIVASRNLSGIIVADDSGLEVEALNGAPGIHSARYAGANASDNGRIDKLLSRLTEVESPGNQRRARFRCVLAVARGGEILATFEGAVEGRIAHRPRGSNGFGYDPIFIPDGFEKTFAELGQELKNKISHRAEAIRKFRAELPKLSGEI